MRIKAFAFLFLTAVCLHAQLFTGQNLWLGETIPPANGIVSQPVDSFLDYHFNAGDNGTNLSRNSLAGSAYGITNWFFNPAGGNANFKLFATVAGSNETFMTPITVGGNTFTGTGTNWIREEYQLGTNLNEAIQLDFPASGISEAQWYFKFSPLTNSGLDINLDFVIFYDGAFGTPELKMPGLTTNIAPLIYIHGQATGGGSFTGAATNLQAGTIYLADLVWDSPSSTNAGMVYVKVWNADSGQFVFGSCSDLLATNQSQDQLKIWGGYINPTNSPLYGYIDRSPIWMTSTHVNTNQIPWFPAAPTSPTAWQSGSGSVVVGFTDQNLQLDPYYVDWSTNGGSTWVVNAGQAAQGVTTNIPISGLTAWTNYTFRVYAIHPPSSRISGYATTTLAVTNVANSTWISSFTGGLAGQSQKTNGNVFKANIPMNVTALGAWATNSAFDPDTNKVVCLMTTNCVILYMTNVDVSAHDNAFHWTPIPTYLLTNGVCYILAEANPNANNLLFDVVLTHTTDASFVTDFSDGGSGTGCGLFNACIECDTTHGIWGPNMQYH